MDHGDVGSIWEHAQRFERRAGGIIVDHHDLERDRSRLGLRGARGLERTFGTAEGRDNDRDLWGHGRRNLGN